MSEQPTPEKSIDGELDSLRSAITAATSLVLLLAMGCAIDFAYLGSIEVPGLARLMIVVLLVWLAIRSNLVVMLIMMMVSLMLREPRGVENLNFASVLLTAFVSTGLLYWISRYEEIRRTLLAAVFALSISKTPNSSAPRNHEPTDSLFLMLQETVAASTKIILALLLSLLMLRNRPWAINPDPWFQWSLANQQVLWPGPTLIVVVLGTMILVNELAWRQKTSTQKKMYARSDAVRVHYPDLLRIVRLQRKKKP